MVMFTFCLLFLSPSPPLCFASQAESKSLPESSGTWWSFLEAERAPKPQKKKHLVSIRVPEPLCIALELFLMAITHWDSTIKACMGLLDGTSLNAPFIVRVIHDKTMDCTKEAEQHSERGEKHTCALYKKKLWPSRGTLLKSALCIGKEAWNVMWLLFQSTQTCMTCLNKSSLNVNF